jgi:flavodoxin
MWKILLTETALIETMNACVVYFSRTGNTKRLAQAIADGAKVAVYDLASIEASTFQTCDPLVLGTPVEGSSPAKETMAFINSMPKVESKKAILFCTFRIFGNNRTMNTMEKALAAKGYETVLKVSKKGMKPEKEADFSEIVCEVKKCLEKLSA